MHEEMDSYAELHFQVLKLENTFQRACSQVTVLSNLIQELEIRYNRAADNNMKSYCYMLHLRLTTAESMLTLYKKVASTKAEEIERLACRLQQVEPEPLVLYESDSEWD